MKNKIRFLAMMLIGVLLSVNLWGETYTKATSLKAGDKIVLVCEATSQELTGISTTSTKYGIGTPYTTSVVGTYVLDVVAGSETGSFSFKTGDNYLRWNSGNSLDAVATSVAKNSSWMVTFDASGNATIKNANDATRVIWWNVSSPRFACYTGKSDGNDYKYVQIYKQESSCTEPTTPLSITASPASIALNKTSTITANGGNGGTISYEVSPTTGSVSAGIFSATAMGTYTITATQAVNAGKCAQEAQCTVTVTSITYTDYLTECTEPTQVATPTFSPIAGTYSGAQTVTITCSTEGAVIHYTTDGTTPTASSSTYSSAITVNGDMTIKAIAVKGGMTDSEVATAAYVINYTVTFDANGHGSNPAAVNAKYNQTITAPTAPTASGWVFGGWYKEQACTNAWNFATDKVTSSITLYAKWTHSPLSSIAVTGQKTSFYIGESFSFDGTCTATYEDGSKATVTPTNTSVNVTTPFASVGSGTATITYTEGGVTKTTTYSITISALPTWTITLNPGSGTVVGGETSIVVVQEQSTTLPSCEIECEDSYGEWEFAGWKTGSGVGTVTTAAQTFVETNYTPSSDVTLYAVYKAVDASGGSEDVQNKVGMTGSVISGTWSGTSNYSAMGGKYCTNTAPDGATKIKSIYVLERSNWTSGAELTITNNTKSTTVGTIIGGTGTIYPDVAVSPGDAIRFTGESGKTVNFSGITVTYVVTSSITRYWSIPCNEKYTMTFHGVGGDASTIDWTGLDPDNYVEVGATTITAYPTCATAETGWTFLGWRTSDYNDGKELDEESASTDDPGVNTIYNNGKGYALNSGTTSPCGDGVRCVDMYPVFTKFVENDKPDIATLASGSKYYMYYTSDAAGYQDDYSSLDGQTTRIYAHTFSSASFSSTTLCESAQLFEFTKRADGNWDIRMRNAEDNGYVNQSYIYTAENNTDLYTREAQPDHGWVIETVIIGGNTMVKMQYAGNTNPDRFMKVLDGGGSSASGTFKNYSEDCEGSTMYHAIYLGSCSNRIFSSNPGHAATWEVYGNFSGSFTNYPMTNGMLVVPNLAANTTYQFKLRKTTDGGSTYTWFGDKNENNTYTTSGVEWTLDGSAGGYNVNLVTGAAGSYTFTASHMSATFPGITVTYPAAYTITFDGNGNDGGSMTDVTNIAAGDDVALPTPGFTKTDWNCIGWTADVDVTVNSTTITAGNFIPKTATIEDINSNITLTAVWEQLVITQAAGIYEVVVNGTLQLTLTAYYSPNITTGATYTWATNNTNFATVDEDGLVTGHQAVNTGEYVVVTSSFGTESNHYTIVVKSAACETWGLHYWNTESDIIGDLCFEQVGETNEWRTDEEHLFTLPSNSSSDKLILLYGGVNSAHAEEWAFRWVPTIASQAGGCGENDGNHYSGQDAIGYFRIFANSEDKNSYLGFQPVYSAAFGRDGEDWQIKDFANTGNANYHGHEYATDINDMIEVPEGYNTDVKLYVGTKNSHGTVNQVNERSNMRLMSYVPELNGTGHAHEFGRLYIHPADACNDASNYDVHFVRFYRLHYDLDGGETAAAYDDQFAWSGADAADRTFTLATTPTKEGYTFLGWSVSIGGGEATTKQPSESVILTDDAVAAAIWAQNYTVTYDLDGYSTSCSGATTHYCGETVTVCEDPEAVTGYTFGGWKTTYKINDDYGAGAVLQPGTTFVMPCERVVDVVFTAKLTANQYNIIYKDQNDAEFSGKHETGHPTKHTYDTETTLMGATKTGYEFGGWYKDAACEGAVVTTLGATEYTADITLYAKWTVNSYHATLDANGGTGEGGFDFTFGGTSVDNFTSTIARAGYDLNGFWSAASGGTQILNNDGTRTTNYHNSWITVDGGWVKADNDGVLYAHWTAKSGIPYTVEYYQMGLDGNYPATATETKGGTGTAGAKVTPTPKTYTGFTTPDPIEATIAGDGSTVIKYYYVRHQHAFAWEFNGGVTSGDYTPANPNMYYGAPITYPVIAKEGYAFLGWSSTDETMPDADLTITAQWGAYENYRTYCGDAITFYAQNGTEPEETFVVTTDNNKITTPTLAQTGFTVPTGWVLLGWIKVGGDTKIVEPGKANVAAADGDEYNAVWTHITVTGTVLTTSAVGVQVGTTIHVEGTTNNAYGLRVSFVDTKGTDDTSDDVTYQGTTGETSVTKSDFRLANTSYTYIDGSIIQIEGTAAGDTHSSDYNVVYTPKTANEIDNYVLQIQVMQTSATALDGAVYTLNLKGRALPDNFVIAEYRDSKWYALPADMNGSNTYAGKEIMVEGTGMDRVVTNATLDMVYSMKTYNFDRTHVLFQSQFNQGHLWAATGNETGINDNAKTISGQKDPYSWMPTPQNETLDTYVMSNVNNYRTLAMNGTNFGMYSSFGTNIVYFIPLKAEEYVEKEMMMVEWFPTKVLVEVDEDALTGARAKINNVEVADVTASDTKYGTHLYEITGLNTLVDNAANKLTILYTKEETTYGHEFDIPVIVSNKTYILSSTATETKFPWTQAVYNTADLVVRDNSVLTVDGATDAANTFGNVTIYPTSKVIVPAQASEKDVTMTTTTMTLFGGIDEIYNGSEYTLTKYIVPQLVLNGKLVHNETTSGLVYDVRVDKAQYYNFALPYTSMYELVTDNKGGYDYDYWVKVYNGQTRVETGNGWVYYDWDADPWALNIGTGYMLEAQSNVGQNYVILRHPLGYSNTGGKYAQNLGGHQSGTAEATKAAITVTAPGMVEGEIMPGKTANNVGWNFIANPFMANFQLDQDGETAGTIQVGQLVEHKEGGKWNGKYDWDAEGSKNVRYVTLYDNGSDTYTQLPMSEAVLAPFTGFFVQIAKEGTIVFDIAGRANEAPARMLSEDELPSEMEIFLHATCQGQKDDAVLFINDNLRRDNAKEFPNEMTKQENANTLNFYTFGGDDVKMYANGMSYEDAQGWSKAGVKVAAAGEYTFSVASDKAEYIQQVILKDMDSNTEYDLMNNDAKIYLDKGEMNDRFFVKIVFGKHNIGTGITERYDVSAPEKFILNDHMYIRANGVLFDGVGKRVK